MKLSIALVAAALALGSVSAEKPRCHDMCCVRVPSGCRLSPVDDSKVLFKNGIAHIQPDVTVSLYNEDNDKIAEFDFSQKKDACRAKNFADNEGSFKHDNQAGKHKHITFGKGVYSYSSFSHSAKNFSYKTETNSQGEQYSGYEKDGDTDNGHYHAKSAQYTKDQKNDHASASVQSSSWSSKSGIQDLTAYPASVGGYFDNRGGHSKKASQDREQSSAYGSGHRESASGQSNDAFGNTDAYNAWDNANNYGNQYSKSHKKAQHSDEYYNRGEGGVGNGRASGYLVQGKKSHDQYDSSDSNGNNKHKDWNKGNQQYHQGTWGNAWGSGGSDKGSSDESHRHRSKVHFDADSEQDQGIGGHAGPEGIHGTAGSHHSSSKNFHADSEDANSKQYNREQRYHQENPDGTWSQGYNNQHQSSWNKKESHVESHSYNSGDQRTDINKGN
ncbi:hypothetical protein ACQY0O_001717 [Thecaphora frezii]